MKTVQIINDYITLGQFLKFTGIIGSGAFAKQYLAENKVTVNNELENRRGRKLYDGYEIIVDKETYIIRK